MSKAPDLALRRMVADLAGLGAADVEAILAGLEPAQQARVRAMLADLRGEARAVPARDTAPDEVWSPSLAGWLRERLDAASADEDGELSLRPPRPAMTPAASAALSRAAFAAGGRVPAPPPAPAPVVRKPGPMDQLRSVLGRGRR